MLDDLSRRLVYLENVLVGKAKNCRDSPSQWPKFPELFFPFFLSFFLNAVVSLSYFKLFCIFLTILDFLLVSFLGDTRGPHVFLKGGFPVGVDYRNIGIVECVISIHVRSNDHRTQWQLNHPSKCINAESDKKKNFNVFFIVFKYKIWTWSNVPSLWDFHDLSPLSTIGL